MFFQKDAETMPRAKIREIQLERLRYTVRYCYENVPFYKKKLDDAGVTPDSIKTLDDIRRIPPTTKADLRDNYPSTHLPVQRASLRWSGTRRMIWICGRTAWRAFVPQQVQQRMTLCRFRSATVCSQAPLGCTMGLNSSAAPWCPIPAATRKQR